MDVKKGDGLLFLTHLIWNCDVGGRRKKKTLGYEVCTCRQQRAWFEAQLIFYDVDHWFAMTILPNFVTWRIILCTGCHGETCSVEESCLRLNV